jgi:hypothetical protein
MFDKGPDLGHLFNDGNFQESPAIPIWWFLGGSSMDAKAE